MKTIWSNKLNTTGFLALCGAALLQACGGGSAGGGTVVTPLPATGEVTVLSGTVIFDAPAGKAKVEIRDAEGHYWSTQADAAGRYRLELPAGAKLVPPVLVKASGTGNRWEVGNGATLTAPVVAGVYSAAMVPGKVDPSKGIAAPFQLYAAAGAAGAIHVTPATSLVVERLTGNRAEAALQNLGKTGTSIAPALSPEKIAAAAAAVKQTLGEIGLPPALIDDPASAALVPVDVASAYQKLVTGDILSAAVNLLTAIVDNQIDFGCSGEGFGLMSDDGLKRPSCLPGANAAQAWRLTSFIAIEGTRSLDIETRAQELAGVHAQGGGWKFQSGRLTPEVRLARLNAKIVPILASALDVRPGSNGVDALRSLRATSSNTWERLSEQICKDVTVSELSELTHSYQQLKLNMKPNVVTPTDDAAAQLLITGSSIKSTAINRIVPVAFEDGSRTSSCPVWTKQNAKFLALAAGYGVGGGGRPPLADLLRQFDAGLTAWLAYPPDQRTGDGATLVLLTTPAILLFAHYQSGPSGPFDMLNEYADFNKFTNSEITCAVYGQDSAQCRATLFTPAMLRASAAAWAATIPPDIAKGSGEEDGNGLLVRLAGDIARIAMTEYEQHFDLYFDALSGFAPVPFKIVDAQGVVAYHWQRINPEYAASVLAPDVSKVGYRTNGSSLELVGSFSAVRTDVAIPAFVTDSPAGDPFRLVMVNVDPEQLPALAMCAASDQACMGRLRRTRRLTPAQINQPTTGSVSINFATTRIWQEYVNSPGAREETLPFDRGYAETTMTLKAK